MGNINDNFFDGYYKEIWRTIIPDELTVKETDFMVSFFGLKEGSKVLDLMCGYGRHAFALARKGIEVTATDNLAAYVDEVKQKAIEENLPVKTIQSPVLDFATDEKYNLALCMGNSINFFDEQDTIKLLSNISDMLQDDGVLLINSWSLAEIVFKNFTANSWSDVGGIKFLSAGKIFFHPTRIETESIMIAADGATETKLAVDYIFSVNEWDAMLAKAGLRMKEVYSIPGRKKFTLGEPRAYIIAEKV